MTRAAIGRTLAGVAWVLSLVACTKETTPPSREAEGRATTGSVSAPLASVHAAPSAAATGAADPARLEAGDPARGKTLIETFECSRCHEVPEHPAAERDKHCVRCHDDISRGKFPAPADAMARWKKTVDAYTVNPSLVGVGSRFEPAWLHAFLSNPVDLRPHLSTSMPKLALSEQDAADLVAYLTSTPGPSEAPAEGDLGRGRDLMEKKSCGSCHAFSGVPAFAVQPDPLVSDETQKRAVRLAPDLRFTRERFKKGAIVAWLLDPKALKPDTLMPAHALDRKDASDIAAYLYGAELAPAVPPPMPERLPVLTRRVEFQEVMDRVFGVTCRHCHSDPDASLGDGGPGNTGGFGFKPKGLDLATYRGVAAGYLDETNQRASVFTPLEDGTPRLLATLLARQMEERGRRHETVRGMPLGLPALTPEQVQLVESWIAQGRPR